MAYRLRLDREAVAALRALPPAIQLHVALELQRLAQNPGELSRPASFPHPLDGQLFDIEFQTNDTEYFITAMFRYLQDERDIEVAWIVYVTRPQQP